MGQSSCPQGHHHTAKRQNAAVKLVSCPLILETARGDARRKKVVSVLCIVIILHVYALYRILKMRPRVQKPPEPPF